MAVEPVVSRVNRPMENTRYVVSSRRIFFIFFTFIVLLNFGDGVKGKLLFLYFIVELELSCEGST